MSELPESARRDGLFHSALAAGMLAGVLGAAAEVIIYMIRLRMQQPYDFSRMATLEYLGGFLRYSFILSAPAILYRKATLIKPALGAAAWMAIIPIFAMKFILTAVLQSVGPNSSAIFVRMLIVQIVLGLVMGLIVSSVLSRLYALRHLRKQFLICGVVVGLIAVAKVTLLQLLYQTPTLKNEASAMWITLHCATMALSGAILAWPVHKNELMKQAA